jgi:hypothetical protein
VERQDGGARSQRVVAVELKLLAGDVSSGRSRRRAPPDQVADRAIDRMEVIDLRLILIQMARQAGKVA